MVKKSRTRPKSTVDLSTVEVNARPFRQRIMSEDASRMISSGGAGNNDRASGKEGRKKSLKSILKLKKRKKSKTLELRQNQGLEVGIKDSATS